jgi:hypothetical protein
MTLRPAHTFGCYADHHDVGARAYFTFRVAHYYPLLAAAIDMGIVPPEVVVYRLAQVILTDIAFNTECDDEDVVLPKTCKPLI